MGARKVPASAATVPYLLDGITALLGALPFEEPDGERLAVAELVFSGEAAVDALVALGAVATSMRDGEDSAIVAARGFYYRGRVISLEETFRLPLRAVFVEVRAQFSRPLTAADAPSVVP